MTEKQRLTQLLEEAAEKMDCPQMDQVAAFLLTNGVHLSNGVQDGIKLRDACKAARKAMKLSQWDFAKIIGTCQREVSYIEHGYLPTCNKTVETIWRYYKKLFGRGKSK